MELLGQGDYMGVNKLKRNNFKATVDIRPVKEHNIPIITGRGKDGKD